MQSGVGKTISLAVLVLEKWAKPHVENTETDLATAVFIYASFLTRHCILSTFRAC